MLEALFDCLRLARAGAVMARFDVVLPVELRRQAPLAARLFGGLLRLATGRIGAGPRAGERFAGALEKLGPTWIKLGQLLATRPDLIGAAAAADMSRLKDRLPSFPRAQASKILAAEFGEDAKRLFPALGEPVAAASMAQVHRVETAEGARAVKILRPGVENAIGLELRAMRRAAALAARSGDPELRRLDPVGLVETMARSLNRELDLRLEAAACSAFAEIASGDSFVHAPRVDWERTSRRVLTTEWIEGASLTNPGAISSGDRIEFGNRIIRGFLASALDHGFFHADIHEGNIILDPKGRLVLVDYGIMGRIGPAERRFLAEILAGFLTRNYRRISEVHFEAGYVPADFDIDDFALALRSVGEPIFGKTADQLSMSRLLLQLFDITREFGMRLRPELVLLQKTMVQAEGVARNLDPGHDIWAAAKPVVERWTKREFGVEGAGRIVQGAAREALNRIQRLPVLIDKLELAATAIAAPAPAPPAPRGAPPWIWLLAGLLLGAGGMGLAWRFLGAAVAGQAG